MSDRTLYLDLDSTLLDTRPLYEEASMAIFGKVVPYEKLTHWYAYKDYLGDGFYSIFDYALAENMIPKRRLYDGAIKALEDIHDLMDFNIHIISHNTKPKQLYAPYKKWLAGVLTVPFDFTLFGSRHCKISTMKDDPTAFGIVEDKGETIRKAVRAGYPTFVYKQPWNTAERWDLGDSVHVFDDWSHMPLLLNMALTDAENRAIMHVRV